MRDKSKKFLKNEQKVILASLTDKEELDKGIENKEKKSFTWVFN